MNCHPRSVICPGRIGARTGRGDRGGSRGGKSRLLYEFRQRLQDKRVTYLEGRCLSYGSTIPYHPLIDVLRHNCGISETDSPEAIIEKVHFALQEVGMDARGICALPPATAGVKGGDGIACAVDARSDQNPHL